jgi:tetratricopeptide (TPR) repeat protein
VPAPAAPGSAAPAPAAAVWTTDGDRAAGRGCLQRADYPGAIAAFERAIQSRPNSAPAWRDLGVARHRGGDVDGARSALAEALRLDPSDGETVAVLTPILLLSGADDDVLALSRDAVRRSPDCAAARVALADALLWRNAPQEVLTLLDGPPPAGRDGLHWRAHRVQALLRAGLPERARAELEAIAPPWGDAELIVLWRHIPFATPDLMPTIIARMTAAAADETMPPEHRVAGHFFLARTARAKDAKADAFWHCIAGHQLIRRYQPFSRESFRDFVDTSIGAFDAARLAVTNAANDDPTPVFVVGMPRSGTTLVEHILAAHPEVHGAGERTVVDRLIFDLTGSSETADSVRHLAALDVASLTSAGCAFLRDLRALAPDATRIIDKMPANALHLGFLATLLPRARFILCQRDPRDVAISIFQIHFHGLHPFAHDLGDLGFTLREHQRLMTHWRDVLGPRLISVELTDWSDDFGATLRRVLDFVGLPYDPACERFYEQERDVRTSSALQVRQPVNRLGIGRYREYAAFLGPLFAELEVADAASPAR